MNKAFLLFVISMSFPLPSNANLTEYPNFKNFPSQCRYLNSRIHINGAVSKATVCNPDLEVFGIDCPSVPGGEVIAEI